MPSDDQAAATVPSPVDSLQAYRPPGSHLGRLAVDERERFLDAVMVRLGERPLLDLSAAEHRRPGGV